jgi:hypothetical protein
MESLEYTFTLERETKGTFRYAQDEDGEERPAVGTLYLTRSAAAELDNPQRLQVTIRRAG